MSLVDKLTEAGTNGRGPSPILSRVLEGVDDAVQRYYNSDKGEFLYNLMDDACDKELVALGFNLQALQAANEAAYDRIMEDLHGSISLRVVPVEEHFLKALEKLRGLAAGQA